MRTDIHVEVTDTFGGEANYSWVKRFMIAGKEGEEPSTTAIVRRAKKVADWQGMRCDVEDYGDSLTVKPLNTCQIMFITFNPVGIADKGTATNRQFVQMYRGCIISHHLGHYYTHTAEGKELRGLVKSYTSSVKQAKSNITMALNYQLRNPL